MQDISSITNLRLSSFLSKETMEEREFTYSGINGIAEVLGWHIIFFRDLENPSYTTAISLNDMDYNEELTDIVNTLLKQLHINLEVGDNFDKISRIYGNPYSFDEIIEGSKRYNFLLNGNRYFVSFGVDNSKGLTSIEIICNEKILNGIIHEKWR
jgi:hypothetical protein